MAGTPPSPTKLAGPLEGFQRHAGFKVGEVGTVNGTTVTGTGKPFYWTDAESGGNIKILHPTADGLLRDLPDEEGGDPLLKQYAEIYDAEVVHDVIHRGISPTEAQKLFVGERRLQQWIVQGTPRKILWFADGSKFLDYSPMITPWCPYKLNKDQELRCLRPNGPAGRQWVLIHEVVRTQLEITLARAGLPIDHDTRITISQEDRVWDRALLKRLLRTPTTFLNYVGRYDPPPWRQRPIIFGAPPSQVWTKCAKYWAWQYGPDIFDRCYAKVVTNSKGKIVYRAIEPKTKRARWFEMDDAIAIKELFVDRDMKPVVFQMEDPAADYPSDDELDKHELRHLGGGSFGDRPEKPLPQNEIQAYRDCHSLAEKLRKAGVAKGHVDSLMTQPDWTWSQLQPALEKALAAVPVPFKDVASGQGSVKADDVSQAAYSEDYAPSSSGSGKGTSGNKENKQEWGAPPPASTGIIRHVPSSPKEPTRVEVPYTGEKQFRRTRLWAGPISALARLNPAELNKLSKTPEVWRPGALLDDRRNGRGVGSQSHRNRRPSNGEADEAGDDSRRSTDKAPRSGKGRKQVNEQRVPAGSGTPTGTRAMSDRGTVTADDMMERAADSGADKDARPSREAAIKIVQAIAANTDSISTWKTPIIVGQTPTVPLESDSPRTPTFATMVESAMPMGISGGEHTTVTAIQATKNLVVALARSGAEMAAQYAKHPRTAVGPPQAVDAKRKHFDADYNPSVESSVSRTRTSHDEDDADIGIFGDAIELEDGILAEVSAASEEPESPPAPRKKRKRRTERVNEKKSVADAPRPIIDPAGTDSKQTQNDEAAALAPPNKKRSLRPPAGDRKGLKHPRVAFASPTIADKHGPRSLGPFTPGHGPGERRLPPATKQALGREREVFPPVFAPSLVPDLTPALTLPAQLPPNPTESVSGAIPQSHNTRETARKSDLKVDTTSVTQQPTPTSSPQKPQRGMPDVPRKLSTIPSLSDYESPATDPDLRAATLRNVQLSEHERHEQWLEECKIRDREDEEALGEVDTAGEILIGSASTISPRTLRKGSQTGGSIAEDSITGGVGDGGPPGNPTTRKRGWRQAWGLK